MKKDIKRMSVTMSTTTYNTLCELADKFHLSRAFIVRLAIENRLEQHLGNIMYIDKEQGQDILKQLLEISDSCRAIHNNIRRIGINHDLQLKLKIAKKKYMDTSNSIYTKQAGIFEYNSILKEIEKSAPDMEALQAMLKQYEDLIKQMEELLCLIHE